MTTMTTTSGAATVTGRFRTGLVISALLALTQIPFVFLPTPDTGQDGPPELVLVVNALLGLVSIACVVVAWRSGNRLAVRINAAILIINALLAMPPFFIDIDAWVKVSSAVVVILTVVALVLTLRREHTPYTVTD
ncbi:MAG: hypothetical protein QM747_07160 [Nocardioides sp.]